MYLKILTSAWSLSPVGAFWVMLMGTFAINIPTTIFRGENIDY